MELTHLKLLRVKKRTTTSNYLLVLVTALTASMPNAAPSSCAAMNGRTEPGSIPAKVLLNTLPIVTAGFAKEVDEVKK